MLEEMKGVTAVLGDAKDEAAVQSCMEGCVAAVTTLGGKTDDGVRIDYIGNSNVIEQAGILGCERIILVTSVGCGPTKAYEFFTFIVRFSYNTGHFHENFFSI